MKKKLAGPRNVTPRAGVWVEISSEENENKEEVSLPVRECGLKFEEIEKAGYYASHSPCGSVG